jgi:outer membrane receptor for ferrienterochelin and colicins
MRGVSIADATRRCVIVVGLALGADAAAEMLNVDVRSGGKPILGAAVRVGTQQQTTDAAGRAGLTLDPGEYEVSVEASGYLPASGNANVQPGDASTLQVELQALQDQVTVTAARSSTRLEDQPLRVEVIDRDDIEEKALMTPGSVAMLLGETTGLRVQTTAPSLGAANVRIQGLRGHYSQLLADGLPLYGAQGDSFSLLQVPPLDLGQVEVIKGVASALYGTSALGGVVNLVSRRPREAQEELLVNATTLGGVDTTGWIARPGKWSWSTIGGYHGQERRDIDGDGWTSVAGYDRGMVRPRLFFDNDRGTSILATAGVTAEDREGGTTPNAVAPDGRPFEESLRTRHADAGGVAKWLASSRLISVRGSVVRNAQDRVFGEAREHGTHLTWFGEGSVTGTTGRHTWVAGAAFQQDRYDSRELPQFNYTFRAPAVFLQDEVRLSSRVTLAASARADVHSEYGTLVSPRLSVLAKPSDKWTLRASAGLGAFAPTPFGEETDETGLSRLQPLSGLRAEKGRGGSVDATFHQGRWDVSGTVFGSVVEHATQLQTVGATTVALVNGSEPTRTYGTELVARYRAEGFTAMLTHAWTRSSELDVDTGTRREVPLTPLHFLSLNVIYDNRRFGSFGLETYYTGRQELDDDPWLDSGVPYFLIGALAQRRFGKVLFFINAENLLDVRQTREESVVLPARRPDGRWLVDSWAPLDGRVLNGGFRVAF